MCAGLSETAFGSATQVRLVEISDPDLDLPIDQGLMLSFAAPNSFTGEDVVEFQLHGGPAIVDKVLDVLARADGLRHAEAGEFTYRAFENGKLDLTQAEGIADLIASESEAQRRLAYDAVAGQSRKLVEDWLERLVSLRALIEAEIDFVDEDDIPGSLSDQVWVGVDELSCELESHINAVNAGEIIRNGFRVTLLGKPNAGKSTLLNCLAGRDVAIVTDLPGTTRDVLEVKLNLAGQVVIISDTAGIHETRDIIEQEGIRRAQLAAERGDMTIWLHAADDENMSVGGGIKADLHILSKRDIDRVEREKELTTELDGFDLAISSTNEQGIDRLIETISGAAKRSIANSSSILFSHERQKQGLVQAQIALKNAGEQVAEPLEIRAENLRVASSALGKLVGSVDVEDILGVIFSKFCVGK